MPTKARNFTVTATTSASAERVFALVCDSSTWPSWTPIQTAKRDNLAPDGSEQVGTIRTFRTGIATSVEEVIGVFPGRKFTYALRKGMPLSNHVASVELEQDGSRCTISWHEAFEPKIPGTGAFLSWFLRVFIQKCMDGLVKKAEN